MRLSGFASVLAIAAAVLANPGCGGRLVKQYEYEEQLHLRLDGSATVIVNASIPALVALHGLDLPVAPRARLDRQWIRQVYETGPARVTRVSRPWRRDGRRFVQVRLQVDDIRQLSDTSPFGWSDYVLERASTAVVYRQTVGAARNQEVGEVGWTGEELVAFRLHLPSRIQDHNASSGRVDRGNILAWEQALGERLVGAPLTIEARMDPRSILYTTLWLFGGAFAAAVALMGVVVWWVRRKGAGLAVRTAARPWESAGAERTSGPR